MTTRLLRFRNAVPGCLPLVVVVMSVLMLTVGGVCLWMLPLFSRRPFNESCFAPYLVRHGFLPKDCVATFVWTSHSDMAAVRVHGLSFNTLASTCPVWAQSKCCTLPPAPLPMTVAAGDPSLLENCPARSVSIREIAPSGTIEDLTWIETEEASYVVVTWFD